MQSFTLLSFLGELAHLILGLAAWFELPRFSQFTIWYLIQRMPEIAAILIQIFGNEENAMHTIVTGILNTITELD